jgi:aspartate/methionine/tyrosine aminotransferase
VTESRRLSARIRAVSQVPSRSVAELPVEFLGLHGAPIVPPPPHIVEAAERAVHEAVYPPARGLPELREAIADAAAAELGWRPQPDAEVIVTNGGMQAINAAFVALLDPGDEVLLPAPCFFYHQAIALAGGVPIHVPSDPARSYRPDWEALAAAAGPRTKLIVVTTPANPTGYVLTDEDVRELSELAEENDLAVVCDEAYDLLVYDGRRHLSPLREEALRERTVLARSFTKSYALAPWRLGYLVAAGPLAEGLARAVAWATLSVAYASQAVGVAALRGPRDWLPGVLSSYQTNRDRVCAAVARMEGLSCHVPQGAAFVWLDVRGVGAPSVVVADRLARELGLPATAGEHFGRPGFVRIPFGGDPKTIDELARRLTLASAWSLVPA